MIYLVICYSLRTGMSHFVSVDLSITMVIFFSYVKLRQITRR